MLAAGIVVGTLPGKADLVAERIQALNPEIAHVYPTFVGQED